MYKDPTKNCENTLIERTPKTIFKSFLLFEKRPDPLSTLLRLLPKDIKSLIILLLLLLLLWFLQYKRVSYRYLCTYMHDYKVGVVLRADSKLYYQLSN